MVSDPAVFFRSAGKPVVVFDEIHQLKDPSRVLKVGADLFPELRILATGSSTLAASQKFRDTLTGRKRNVHLVPVLWDELDAFGATLQKRLFHGGLPQALLAESKSPSFYREWLDSFFARDVQRLFGFRDVNRFNALLEYVLRQSGGQLEVSRAAAALGLARQTVQSHLDAMEITNAVTLVRPFHGGGQGGDRPDAEGVRRRHGVRELRPRVGPSSPRGSRHSLGSTSFSSTCKSTLPTSPSATGATAPAARSTSSWPAAETRSTPSSASGTRRASRPAACGLFAGSIRRVGTSSSLLPASRPTRGNTTASR